MHIVSVVSIWDTWDICLVFFKQIPDNQIELSLCLQNTKQISHVSQIKTTETIRMGLD